MCRLSWNLGASTSWNPLGLSRPLMGLLYLLPGLRRPGRLHHSSPPLPQPFPPDCNIIQWNCVYRVFFIHYHFIAHLLVNNRIIIIIIIIIIQWNSPRREERTRSFESWSVSRHTNDVTYINLRHVRLASRERLADACHVSDRTAADTPSATAFRIVAECEVNCKIMHSIEKSTRTMTLQIGQKERRGVWRNETGFLLYVRQTSSLAAYLVEVMWNFTVEIKCNKCILYQGWRGSQSLEGKLGNSQSDCKKLNAKDRHSQSRNKQVYQDGWWHRRNLG